MRRTHTFRDLTFHQARRIPLEPKGTQQVGGFTTVVEPLTAHVEVSIDLERLAQVLGQKALGSKRRTTTLLDGLIRVSTFPQEQK